jgi:hypothetical protein
VKEKLIITLKNSEDHQSVIERPLFDQIKESIIEFIGFEIPKTLYLGGDRDLLIRFISHIVLRARLEHTFVDDTEKYSTDPDFEIK